MLKYLPHKKKGLNLILDTHIKRLGMDPCAGRWRSMDLWDSVAS